jgi:hypothetical protein
VQLDLERHHAGLMVDEVEEAMPTTCASVHTHGGSPAI